MGDEQREVAVQEAEVGLADEVAAEYDQRVDECEDGEDDDDDYGFADDGVAGDDGEE